MRTKFYGALVGMLIGGGALLLAQMVAAPTDKLEWKQGADTLADANAHSVFAFVGANADKVVVNPNDATAGAGTALTFTCVGTASPFTCTSTQTASQLVATTSPGNYRIALVAERRKADGTYAPKAVSAICNFSFADLRPTTAPADLRFVP